MNKLSVRHFPRVYTLSRRASHDYEKIIEDMRARVKNDPDVQAKFKEYDIPMEMIDDVSIEFDDLDVSAKTKDKKIYLNKNMLDADSEVDDPTHYLAHEIIHVLQQLTGDTAGHDLVEDYLMKPTEQSAFQVQIKFKEREEGNEAADEYIEDLLDHHDKIGPERKEIKEILRDE